MLRPSLFLALIIASLPSAAQSPPQTWTLDGPTFSTPAADLRAAAARIQPEPFTDATVLFEQEKYVLTADNRVTHTHQLLYRIETKAGVENWDQTSVAWDPWYQNHPVIKARVIQSDGRVSELDPKTLTDVPAKNESEGTFSDARIHKAPLPAVAIGSIVEEETVVQDKLPFFSGGSVYRVFFARPVPVLRSRLIVEAPSDAPFQSRLHSVAESLSTTEQSGATRRTTVDLAQLPLAVESDINLSTDDIREPFVEFSTGASWASVAAAYQKLAEPQIQPDHIKSLLPASLPQDYLASLQTIVSRLHKEIRYTGIEFGASAIQPQNPTEILKRHYGDCKDKAAFLVAMLRASGIPANLALLDTGPGLDVNPDLPGMNQFDHAIVYVPAAGSHPALFIDAAAEFTHVGDLPYSDQGRRALVIADGTTTLTRTPDAKPADSTLVETRDITLAQYGPAHIVESSATTGHIDSDYRYYYGGAISKSANESLERYAKRNYLAKALTHVDHSEGGDLFKPFTLSLDMAQATRGNSGVEDAAVAIPTADIFDHLPAWFSTDPDRDAKPTAEQQADRKKAEAQRSSSYFVPPSIVEWHYRIAIPEGFVVRALPEDQTASLGPATYSRKFVLEPADNPRFLNATFRFDTVKQRYSTDEALALRKAVLEANRQDYLMLQFDQAGARLIAQGKVRQALAIDRGLIAARPAEPLHHVQFASALLSAGLGDQAQEEARRAVTLDPKSAVALHQLGIALSHNAIGVEYGKGYKRAEAIEAYRKAKALDPDNTYIRAGLALLYEHNPEGDRYAEDASLADAIREYRELKDVDKDAYARYQDNLLYAMLYNRQYKELLAELSTLPTNPTRDAFAVTCVAASQPSAAAVQRAEHIAGDSTQKAAALRLAGIQLMRLNLYPLSADLLSASVQGQSDAAQITGQAQIFRSISHTRPAPLPATDPRSPVQLMLFAMVDGKVAEAVPTFMSRHAFASDAEWKKNLEHNDVQTIRAIAAASQLPLSVMRDLILGSAKLVSEGDETHGYRVSMQMMGAANQNLFVSRDEGKFKIVGDGNDSAELGNYALYLVANHRETEARGMLDWKRDLVHRGGGDDPLEGNLFARFWTSGSEANSIPLAALALTLQKPDSKAPLEPALAAYAASPGDIDLTLLLASAYANRHDTANTQLYLDKLLAKYPDSVTAITMQGTLYDETRNYAAWRALVERRLAKRPTDHDLLSQAAYEAESEQDFARARATLQKLIDAGKATDNDFNSIAWLGLFDDHADAKSIEAGQQAVTLSKNDSFADLHTLACLYAAAGKTTEARELLLKAMTVSYASEPNSEVWFGFGSIYEQFGAEDAAIAAYKKVDKPNSTPIGATATWNLAQARLKSLHAN